MRETKEVKGTWTVAIQAFCFTLSKAAKS
jgi:hypothetical protein